MSGRSYAVLLQQSSRPDRVLSGRVELRPGEALFICDSGGRVVREHVVSADVVSITRGTVRLRNLSAAELILRSGQQIAVAVLSPGGLSHLLDTLAPAPASRA